MRCKKTYCSEMANDPLFSVHMLQQFHLFSSVFNFVEAEQSMYENVRYHMLINTCVLHFTPVIHYLHQFFWKYSVINNTIHHTRATCFCELELWRRINCAVNVNTNNRETFVSKICTCTAFKFRLYIVFWFFLGNRLRGIFDRFCLRIRCIAWKRMAFHGASCRQRLCLRWRLSWLFCSSMQRTLTIYVSQHGIPEFAFLHAPQSIQLSTKSVVALVRSVNLPSKIIPYITFTLQQ